MKAHRGEQGSRSIALIILILGARWSGQHHAPAVSTPDQRTPVPIEWDAGTVKTDYKQSGL